MTAIKRIDWKNTNTTSRYSGLTGHFEIKFDMHEWELDYRAPGSTASVVIGRYPNRSAAMDQAQGIHEMALAPYVNDAVEAPQQGDIYLISALVERPGATGHRACVARFGSRAEAIGSSLDLWQVDGFSVVSYECTRCDNLMSVATEDPA